MKLNLSLIGTTVTATLLVFAMSGCAGNGPQFTKHEKPKNGNGILYVYRPSSLMGAAMYYDVKVDNKVIGTLDNGEYIKKELRPGKKIIAATTESTVSLPVTIQKNKMTCVKAGIGFGVVVGRPTLELVDQATCMKEIKGTKKSID